MHINSSCMRPITTSVDFTFSWMRSSSLNYLKLNTKVLQAASVTLANRVEYLETSNYSISRGTYSAIAIQKYDAKQDKLGDKDFEKLCFKDGFSDRDGKSFNGSELKINCVEDAVKLFDIILGEGKRKDNKNTPENSKDGLFYDARNIHPLIPKLAFPFGIWFRGAGNKEHRLSPNVFRKHKGYYDETSVVHAFQLSFPDHAKTHKTKFEWLTLMEHYFIPTRLLNWSKNILVSLYFASQQDADDKDGAVWLLNAPRLNKNSIIRKSDTILKDEEWVAIPNSFNVELRAEMAIANDFSQWTSAMEGYYSRQFIEHHDAPNEEWFSQFYNAKKAYDISNTLRLEEWDRLFSPLAVEPRLLSERLKFQRGAFTLHSGKCYSSDYCIGDKTKPPPLPSGTDLVELHHQHQDKKPFLRMVEIPAESKSIIRAQLSNLGIHEGTIYPELEHQKDTITKHFYHLLK